MADPDFGDLRDAYEGLEADASLADAAALERFRAALLERSAQQAAFIARRAPHAASVLEVGSGNGRLLVALAPARGLGLELARSRVRFAQRWAADAGLDGVRFAAADALHEPLETAAFDVAVCITGALGYFEPLAAGAAERLLRRLWAALEPGGLLVLELYPHARERRLLAAAGGEARLWHELAPDDPWRFYLSRLVLDGDVLTHDKTFVHRTTGEVDEGRRERLHLYDAASIRALLERAGFAEIELFADWTGAPYDAEGELMVVVAAPRSSAD